MIRTTLHSLRRLGLPAVASLLAACATPGVIDLSERPAEGALMAGLRAYDEGQYFEAERSLQQALKLRLQSERDVAAAHKTLAFIFCTSGRTLLCEGAFRSARKADPRFVLSKSEAGHPVWGPVYRRVLP